MITLKHHLCALGIGALLVGAGCTPPRAVTPATQPSAPSGGSVAQASPPADRPANTTTQPSSQPADSVNIEATPNTVSVPNPLYHPGRSESLDISGKLEGPKSVTLTGNITFIVTRENSHGRPVNVMNTTVVLYNEDGKREQFETKSVYLVQPDGRLKLLYKGSGSDLRWVENSTCAGEPRDYIDGQSQGCEVRFDNGSTETSTTAVSKDGDYLKVMEISKITDKDGQRDSSETYWLDPTTGHFVRYSGAVTGSDGYQMTLTGN